MLLVLSDYVKSDPTWKEDPRYEYDYTRLDPFDGFDLCEKRYSTIDECMEAGKGWYQEFNLLAFHIHCFYGIPKDHPVICRKRRGLKWLTCEGFDYSSDYRGVVHRRKSER